jgi:hypothetical protein
MTIAAAIESAQGGRLYEKLAHMTGLSASDCRAAMEGLGPAIAARMQETAHDPEKLDELIELLEDNQGDLLDEGELDSRDTEQDGNSVLISAYGSQDAARNEACTTARALRLEEDAMLRIMPVAAALVLAVLAKRHRELAGPVEEAGAVQPAEQAAAPERSGGGILSVFLAAIGAGIARAIANRLLPRRRRRYGYRRRRYAGNRGYSGRRRTRRQPSLEEVFRDLLR